ncbi:MAG: (2Fe-2S)-binding protein [Nitrososphaerota archaeon]|nr:(2Fe-2S)-binding protein [Nitrososphaerota archaeon]
MAKGKKRAISPSKEGGESPWSRPISRRDFVKTGIAVGGVAGASVVVAGRGGLQALQVGQTTGAGAASTTDPFAARTITLHVNGKDYQVMAEPRTMLANVLRDSIGLTGTKRPCNRMECGGCTVLIDNVPYEACQFPALRAGGGQEILTIEAGPGYDRVVAALQTAWVNADAGQCAFCSPGFIMSAAALLKSNPNPSVGDIKTALSGNICRCGAYLNIIEAVQNAAAGLSGTGT